MPRLLAGTPDGDESRGLLATVDARAAGVAPLYGGFSRPAVLASGTLACPTTLILCVHLRWNQAGGILHCSGANLLISLDRRPGCVLNILHACHLDIFLAWRLVAVT